MASILRVSLFISILLGLFFAFQNCSNSGSDLNSDSQTPAPTGNSFVILSSQTTNYEVLEGTAGRLFVEVQVGDEPVLYEWRKQGQASVLSDTHEYNFTAALSSSGIYTVSLNDGLKQSTIEFQVTVVDESQQSLPQIATQTTTSFTKSTGANWNLTLSVSGTPTPALQWYKGPLTGGVAVNGQTSNTLSLTNLQATHQGDYYLAATNALGTVKSQLFHLQVSPGGSSGYNGTHIYLGATGKLRHWFFKPSTETLENKGDINFSGAKIGGIDHINQKLVATDDTTLQWYTIAADFSLTSITSKNFVANTFVTVAQDFGKYLFFGANFSAGKFTYGNGTGDDLQGFQTVKTVTFPGAARSHSTSYSSSLKLVFVANMGTDTVEIYNASATNATSAGQISVAAPRNVLYDETYGKLYVVTQAATGNGQVKIYTITKPTATTASANEVGSYTNIKAKGADLQINHERDFLVTTARETNNENIYVIPLTANGTIDASRTTFKFDPGIAEPRSVSVSKPGDHIFLTPSLGGTEPDIVVYKLTFNAQNQITNFNKVTQVGAGAEGIHCHYTLDVP